MAVHIPRFPFEEEDNDLYHHIQEVYIDDHIDTWRVDELIDLYGKVSLDEMIKDGLLWRVRDDCVKLTFKITGHLNQTIVKYVNREWHTFHEMLDKFPKHLKCSSNNLKSYLSYLADFNEVQIVTLPGCAITILGADGPNGGPKFIEDSLDLLFEFSGDMETRFVYQMPIDEGVSELNKIHMARRD
jgi:hypothetical protein